MPLDHHCPHCAGGLNISQVTCEDCQLSLQGALPTPRLYRLSAEDQHFVELFVTASGSLKQMAQSLHVSYPTIRNRLNHLILQLEALRAEDAARKTQILDAIEAGEISAKHGMRQIENM